MLEFLAPTKHKVNENPGNFIELIATDTDVCIKEKLFKNLTK